MNNIYQIWTEFSKIQSQVLKGGHVSDLIAAVEKSVDQWKEKPYPSGEDWKYVKFQQLPNTHFRWPEKDEASQQVADQDYYSLDIRNFKTPQVFKKLSLPTGLEIVSELEATDLNLMASAVTNPFESFSRSFYGLGFYLKIDKDFAADKPIRILIDLDSLQGKDLFIQQNIHIDLVENAKAEVFIELAGESFSGLSNLCVGVSCGKGSKIEMYAKEKGGPQSYSVFNVHSRVQEAAHFSCFDLTLPSRWSRHNLTIELAEKDAVAKLRGAYLNNQSNFIDHHTSITHKVGETESYEDYRGILADSAQAVFNGKVCIAKNARKSNSEQINKNLMLSKHAEVDTKPELQIYNDDVKAAHGATVGQLDEEQRFYLQSRGYSDKEAGRVLAKAFVFGLLDQSSDKARNFLSSDLERVLAEMGEQK